MPDNPVPQPPTAEEIAAALGEGGGDGGGGSTTSSSSGGGGGGAPADPLAPYRQALLGMRINPGPFVQLMSQAAREHWSSAEFLWALEDDKAFQRRFPGVSSLLRQGMSVPTAIGQWRQMYSEFKDQFRDQGLTKYARLSPKRFGMWLEEGVDLEEALFRVNIVKMAKTSEPFRAAFNAVLKNKGEQQLDKQGWARFLAGKGDAKVYDMYEGTLLLQELGGVGGLRVKEARQLAKMVSGSEGGPAFSAASFAAALSQVYKAVGGDATAAGISKKDLALATLKDSVTSPEARRRAEAVFGRIEQLVANRQKSQQPGQEATSVVAGRPISEAAPRG